MRRGLSLLLCALAVLSLAACAQTAPVQTPVPAETAALAETVAPKPSPAVADASQTVAAEEVVEEGMTPVYADSLTVGDWPIEVRSSSSMFRIESAVLHVDDGAMTATMTMSGKGYLYVYPGTALEADAAPESARIPFAEDESGAHSFTIPVQALDAPIPCAAFSKNKALWYERTLLFRVDSLPTAAFKEGFFVTAESLGLTDGDYTAAVTLSGGSGKASVGSPARLTVKNGQCTAEIVFSSRNYDYVRIGDEVYLPVNTEGNSSFVLPVTHFDRPMPIVADTVAMSEPHEIAYTLRFDAATLEAMP
ncbi:MAG: hypothetical protein K6F56_11235 [Oscillospiraceae bacterium]|nr:hypothetical protein [Oscillospiraceae bacterium]